ncbi:MAG: hypothetical protein H6985_04400 [Pseudomonadales bacterium]|nr:hypothetical protein [Halioglobus sp.]MCP5128809.1 hypothetical protein [Pseudomonadales bacterium]
MKKLILMLTATAFALSIGGCAKEEGPMEKMGKSLDNAAESVGESAEDAADSVKKAVEE